MRPRGRAHLRRRRRGTPTRDHRRTRGRRHREANGVHACPAWSRQTLIVELFDFVRLGVHRGGRLGLAVSNSCACVMWQ